MKCSSCEKPGVRCDKIITGMKVKQRLTIISWHIFPENPFFATTREHWCPMTVHRTFLFPFLFPPTAESHWVISLSKCNSIRNFINQSLFCQKYFTVWLYESMIEMSSSLSYFTVQSVHFILGWEIHFSFYWASVYDVSLESYFLSFLHLSYLFLTETLRGWIRGYQFTEL